MSDQAVSEAALKLVLPTGETDCETLYSNFAQASFTPTDFTLHFSVYTTPAVMEPPADGVIEVPVHPVVKVTIPLNMVRATMELLERQIDAWEKSFGTLPEQPAAARPPGVEGKT